MGIQFTPQVASAVVEYAEELGLSREQLGNVMLAHPILRSAEFRTWVHVD
jgi:hypothetical protein